MFLLTTFSDKEKRHRKSDVFFLGGRGWIRTTEVSDNRFTVCPLWPLGNSPKSNDRYYITGKPLCQAQKLDFLEKFCRYQEKVANYLLTNCLKLAILCLFKGDKCNPSLPQSGMFRRFLPDLFSQGVSLVSPQSSKNLSKPPRFAVGDFKKNRFFGQPRRKTQRILYVFASISTMGEQKSVFLKQTWITLATLYMLLWLSR